MIWKPGDIFILKYQAEKYLIGRIVSCPAIGKYVAEEYFPVLWNVELFASESRRGLSPFVTLNYDLAKHRTRKVVDEEAEFYELFAN